MKYTIALLILFTVGCGEPNTRYNVHDNGEGSVTLERIPKIPDAPAATSGQTQTDQQKIDALQAQVHELSVENQKLKATTAPSKD
jgi:PBP1b-binding outer membrane lipoprotein LpoB